MKNLIVLVFFLLIQNVNADAITLPNVTVYGKSYLDACLADVETKAKGTAEIKARQIVTGLEKDSAVVGAGTAIVCGLFSVAVLGLDGGLLSLGCGAAATAIAVNHYESHTQENTINATDTYKKAYDEAKKQEKIECVDRYAGV